MAFILIPSEGMTYYDLLSLKAIRDHEIIIVQPVGIEDDNKTKNYPHENTPFILHSVPPSTEFFERKKNPKTKTSYFATLLNCLKHQTAFCKVLEESLASVCEKPPQCKSLRFTN